MRIWRPRYKGLYIIGDGSGITHSLSHASASGVFVARDILRAERRLSGSPKRKKFRP